MPINRWMHKLVATPPSSPTLTLSGILLSYNKEQNNDTYYYVDEPKKYDTKQRSQIQKVA